MQEEKALLKRQETDGSFARTQFQRRSVISLINTRGFFGWHLVGQFGIDRLPDIPDRLL